MSSSPNPKLEVEPDARLEKRIRRRFRLPGGPQTTVRKSHCETTYLCSPRSDLRFPPR